jgi:hypothetical protein
VAITIQKRESHPMTDVIEPTESSTALSVLETIRARLATIKEVDFIPPKNPVKEGDSDQRLVTTHHHRQLFTLFLQMNDEVDALTAEVQELLDLRDSTSDKGSPGFLEQLAGEIRQLQVQEDLLKRKASIVYDLFWLEVCIHFPEMSEPYRFQLYEDWSIGKEPRPPSSEHTVVTYVLSGGNASELFSGLYGMPPAGTA